MKKTIYFKSVRDQDFRILDKPIKGCWIHYGQANPEVIKEVARLARFDEEDIEEILDIYELPRIEKNGEAVVVYLRFPSKEVGKLLYHTQLLTVVITKNYLITIANGKFGFVDRVMKRSKQEELATTQQTKFLLQILELMADGYTRQVRKIRDVVLKNATENKKIKDEVIVALLRLEEVLQEYVLALGPTKNIIEAILTGRYVVMFQDDADLLDDLRISVQQSFDICNLTLKNLVAVRDYYQIIFGNDLNRVMKFLTGLSMILTVPTVIGGLYGMNVRLPLASHPLAFWYILWGTVLLMVILWWWFWRKDWL